MTELPDKRLERLEKLLEELREENLSAPVLVEGKRDRDALRQLGLEGDIELLNVGSSMAERIGRRVTGGQRIIVLTDWDRKGEELFRRLGELAFAEGYPVVERYWRKMRPLIQKDIQAVEDLATLMAQLRRRSEPLSEE